LPETAHQRPRTRVLALTGASGSRFMRVRHGMLEGDEEGGAGPRVDLCCDAREAGHRSPPYSGSCGHRTLAILEVGGLFVDFRRTRVCTKSLMPLGGTRRG